jgi:heme/copper-type cytochrome/quinol oxidase subunit 1
VYIFAKTKTTKMNSRRLYDQVMTIFGTAMVFFYLGLAYFLLFSTMVSHVDIALRTIFAVPFLLYGVYRAVGSYRKIKENFFESDEE